MKDKRILSQLVKVSELEHDIELQHKELEAGKLKLKKSWELKRDSGLPLACGRVIACKSFH